MYFSSFPSILYDSVGNNDFKIVTNLLRRVSLRAKIREDTLLFDRYDVRGGETPEIIAHKLYGDSELHWIDKCGHAAMMERPEEFNKALDPFLERVIDHKVAERSGD